MTSKPTGTVTFLFTDIEGSTKLAQQYPDAMPILLARHHEILKQGIQAQNGYIFQNDGDSLAVAFHSAIDALNAASHVQQLLQKESWSPAPIQVRMGIHTGTAKLNDASAATIYTGYATLATTQRVMSAGHGGQILLSGVTCELVRDALPAETQLLDLGEKRLKDLLRPQHLYQLSISGLQTNFPPLKTLDSFRNNLPRQLTTFIGREKEIVEVKQELESHRLVTLTGPGGIGKTRLSQQVATQLLETFSDGVWFVELAPLTDPDLIPQAIHTMIGLVEQPGKSILQVLIDFLREKKVLLILDNCEHLVEACAQLTNTLLGHSPSLKILASSREALGVKGEVAWHVPSLSLPDPKKIREFDEFDQLTQYEAVHLFIDRASLANPHFLMTKDNAPATAQICYRLDGIPLAIELAAARVRGLSVEQIASRLDDRFRLLTSGARTVLPRHQTLQALIDWSHDLLSEPERTLLRRFSVFAGGWTLEAAESVCAGDSLGSDQILDVLLHLVDKSLVVADIQRNEPRYRMLETIRQYAREKLWAAGEGEILRERHLAYFVDLAERAEPNLRTFDMVVWLGRLETEFENIRLALTWALESNIEAQLRMASALLWFWHIRGHKQEGIDWLEQGLSIEAAERGNQPMMPGRAFIRGNALNASGILEDISSLGKPGERFEESRALFEALGPEGKQGMAHALFRLSVRTRDVTRRKAMLDESLTLLRELGDKFGIAECLMFLDGYAKTNNDYAQAMAIEKEHLALRAEIGDKDGMAIALVGSAGSAMTQGNYLEAKKLLDESLAGFRELDNKWGMGLVLAWLSDVAWAQGNTEEASGTLEEALALGQELGDKSFVADRLADLGLMAWAKGDYEKATQKFEVALTASQEVGNQFGTFFALQGLGRVAQSQGDYAMARSLYIEAMAICQELGTQAILALHLAAFATLAVAQNQMKRAARLFGAAEGLMPSIRLAMPTVRTEHEQAVSATRAALGEKAFGAVWNEGKKMNLEEVVAYALNESQQ
jgi:predicted ATPase/class 3 adenylate cyclase